MGQQRGLYAPPAMIGKRCRAAELCDAFVDSEARPAGNLAASPGQEALETPGSDRVDVRAFERLAAEVFVAGRTVEGVRMQKACGDGIEPCRADVASPDVATAGMRAHNSARSFAVRAGVPRLLGPAPAVRRR